RRHTRCLSDWSSDVCSSDLKWRAMSWAHHNSTSLFGIGLAFCRARKDSRFGTIARVSRERGAVKEGRKRIIRTVVAALGLTALRSEERRVGKEWSGLVER